MQRLLVVVDYQNDFIDGALGFEGASHQGQPSYTFPDFRG